MIKAVNIQWDAPSDALGDIPNEIIIPKNIAAMDDDAISEYLSDTTGWCHFGYELEES